MPKSAVLRAASAALMALLIMLSAAPAHAQEGDITEIIFEEGTTSSSYGGTVSGPGGPDVYTFQATAGQQLGLSILGAEGQPVPTAFITAPDGTALAEDTTAVDAQLPATGQYVLEIATTEPDELPYTFTISIVTPDPDEEADPPAPEDEGEGDEGEGTDDTPPTDEQTDDAPAEGDDCTYTVEPGDTLFSIARRFGTTVAELQTANSLPGDAIQAGQTLNVACLANPTPGPEGTRYTVQAGDTLYRIALRYGLTVEELRAANSLTGDFISAGQQLVIPGQQADDAPAAAYVVQPGDTLFSLAQRFGTTVQAIRQANGLTNDVLLAGQSLTLPSAVTAEAETYTVQAGDTLTSIAQGFGITVADLQAANDLTSDAIQAGDVLTIPTRAIPTPEAYTVQPGDTLYSIAARFNIPLAELISTNNIVNPDRINVGDELTLP